MSKTLTKHLALALPHATTTLFTDVTVSWTKGFLFHLYVGFSSRQCSVLVAGQKQPGATSRPTIPSSSCGSHLPPYVHDGMHTEAHCKLFLLHEPQRHSLSTFPAASYDIYSHSPVTLPALLSYQAVAFS